MAASRRGGGVHDGLAWWGFFAVSLVAVFQLGKHSSDGEVFSSVDDFDLEATDMTTGRILQEADEGSEGSSSDGAHAAKAEDSGGSSSPSDDADKAAAKAKA